MCHSNEVAFPNTSPSSWPLACSGLAVCQLSAHVSMCMWVGVDTCHLALSSRTALGTQPLIT